MSNPECEIRLAIMNINCNEPLFYLNSILVNKCSGSCNDIDNPYAKLCIPDVFKNMNIKVFHVMPRINETRHEYLGIRLLHVNVDQMQMFVMINTVGIVINADMNARN